MHKKRPKISTCCRVSEAKIYLFHSTRIDKSGPGYDERLEHPPTQINSSSPWLDRLQTAPMILILYLPGLNTFTRTRTSSEKHWDPCFLISKHSILCIASVMMSFMYNWPGSLWFSLHCLDRNYQMNFCCTQSLLNGSKFLQVTKIQNIFSI